MAKDKMTQRWISLDIDEMENFTGHIAQVVPVKTKRMVKMILEADPKSDNGRSEWVWVRLANGDLLLATFPQGDTYFETEAAPERP